MYPFKLRLNALFFASFLLISLPLAAIARPAAGPGVGSSSTLPIAGNGPAPAAHAVVRGTVPDNSVADGNPARVIGRASLLLKRLAEHPGRLDVFDLPQNERRERIERHFGLRPAD